MDLKIPAIFILAILLSGCVSEKGVEIPAGDVNASKKTPEALFFSESSENLIVSFVRKATPDWQRESRLVIIGQKEEYPEEGPFYAPFLGGEPHNSSFLDGATVVLSYSEAPGHSNESYSYSNLFLELDRFSSNSSAKRYLASLKRAGDIDTGVCLVWTDRNEIEFEGVLRERVRIGKNCVFGNLVVRERKDAWESEIGKLRGPLEDFGQFP